jgi:hypothetical protein
MEPAVGAVIMRRLLGLPECDCADAITGFCATLAAVMAFNFLVNPLGAWHHRLAPGLYRRVSLERMVTPYLLRTSTPQTLLLGLSRVFFGMQIVQGVKDGFENAALSGSSLQEISKEVDIALRNPDLKRIIWWWSATRRCQ